jgi:hypothetical protein
MTRYEVLLFLHVSAAAFLVAGVAYVVVKARPVGIRERTA